VAYDGPHRTHQGMGRSAQGVAPRNGSIRGKYYKIPLPAGEGTGLGQPTHDQSRLRGTHSGVARSARPEGTLSWRRDRRGLAADLLRAGEAKESGAIAGRPVGQNGSDPRRAPDVYAGPRWHR